MAGRKPREGRFLYMTGQEKMWSAEILAQRGDSVAAAVLSSCRPVVLSSCRPVVLSSCRPVVLSSCRPVVLSSHRPSICSSSRLRLTGEFLSLPPPPPTPILTPATAPLEISAAPYLVLNGAVAADGRHILRHGGRLCVIVLLFCGRFEDDNDARVCPAASVVNSLPAAGCCRQEEKKSRETCTSLSGPGFVVVVVVVVMIRQFR